MKKVNGESSQVKMEGTVVKAERQSMKQVKEVKEVGKQVGVMVQPHGRGSGGESKSKEGAGVNLESTVGNMVVRRVWQRLVKGVSKLGRKVVLVKDGSQGKGNIVVRVVEWVWMENIKTVERVETIQEIRVKDRVRVVVESHKHARHTRSVADHRASPATGEHSEHSSIRHTHNSE